MGKGRLEAFSDGVFAILITILVLELHVPPGNTFASLRPLLPIFLAYALSFVYIGIYWNNHHHMLHLTKKSNGAILWANQHLLFWLSLIPVTTAWIGERHFATVPVAVYGVDLLMAGIAYWVLQLTIIRSQGDDSPLAAAVGEDFKGKGSVILYTAAVGLAFLNPYLACALYVAVALMWLIPDPRIENHRRNFGSGGGGGS